MIPPRPRPGPVRRLRLRWSDGSWSIEKQTVVPEMTLLAPADLPAAERGIDGLWCELAGADGRALYRTLLPRRLFMPAEVVNDDGSFSRPGPVPTEVTVDLLLPLLPGGDELRLLAGGAAARLVMPKGLRAAAAPGAPVELARLPLPPVGGEGGDDGRR